MANTRARSWGHAMRNGVAGVSFAPAGMPKAVNKSIRAGSRTTGMLGSGAMGFRKC